MTAKASGYRCPKCKHNWRLRKHNFPFTCACGFPAAKPTELERYSAKGNAVKPVAAPDFGPGTEGLKITKQLGIKPHKKCGCKSFARKMNRWGIPGCRKNRAEIVEHFTTAYENLTWAQVVKAGVNAVASGLAMKLNPLDLPGSLCDLAIARAEAAAKSAA